MTVVFELVSNLAPKVDEDFISGLVFVAAVVVVVVVVAAAAAAVVVVKSPLTS